MVAHRRFLPNWLTAAAAVLLTIVPPAHADWSLDIEGGIAVNGYNDVRIPGDTGSEISLSEDLDADATEFFRARLTIDLGKRHRLSALVAPLSINSTGSVDRDINFNGVVFGAGETLESLFRFDSYRLTYSYAIKRSATLRFDLGFTAKVRDAAIRIEGDGVASEKTNTGFVPLIHFGLDWAFAPDYGLLLRGDALAAPQGRAEDVLLALYTNAADPLRIRLGYRILEGGADNDEVYSFTLVHYFLAGITLTI